MLSGHGGVVIGSEMSGSVRKVTISNCVFDGTDRGIRIKSTRGRGGVVEDIRVSNVVMSNIKQEAVVLNLKYSKMPAEPKSERTPIFRNVHISGMTVTDIKTPIKWWVWKKHRYLTLFCVIFIFREENRNVSSKIVSVSRWMM